MTRKRTARSAPLPHREGLGPSRVRLPGDAPVPALALLTEVIGQQRHRHPEDDADAILQRFRDNEVVLRDGTALSPSSLVHPGTDVYFYRRPAPEQPVPFRIEVLHEDEDIIVVNKPPFLATMPRASHITETVTVRLRRATGNDALTPAHRLDRLTSGVLLMTKRRELRRPYQEMFAERRVRKLYEAIGPDTGITAPALWQHHMQKTRGEIAATLHDALPPNAFTRVRAIDPLAPGKWGSDMARYLLEPLTGRTHQLRVQMAAAGAPIVNDDIYPVIAPYGQDDYSRPMMLASVGLEFTDPLTGNLRRFTAPGYSGLPCVM